MKIVTLSLYFAVSKHRLPRPIRLPSSGKNKLVATIPENRVRAGIFIFNIAVNIYGICWRSKLNACIFKLSVHFQIDMLLGIHIKRVVGIEYIINNFKVYAIRALRSKVYPVETHTTCRLYDGFNDGRNLRKLFEARIEQHSKSKYDYNSCKYYSPKIKTAENTYSSRLFQESKFSKKV
ncbi:MAG: hypothetical protein WKF87_18195 [Chryseolinea sp.]